MKIYFRDIAHRITGISFPIFGISWQPDEPERNIVRRLITDLEDRRVLTKPIEANGWNGHGSYVFQSILEIREKLTHTIEELGVDSSASSSLRDMRRACRNFLDWGENLHPDALATTHHEEFFIRLGQLRAAFGLQLAILCGMYGIDVEDELATIIPGVNNDEEI